MVAPVLDSDAVCDLARTATVSRPARARSHTASESSTGATTVSGPGQKASASRAVRASSRAIREAASRPVTCAISGLN